VKRGGAARGREVEVGGALRSEGVLILEDRLRVGGRVSVSRELEAGEIRVGGKVEAYSVVARKFIETTDLITTRGGKAARIEVGKRGEVEGPLVGQVIIVKDRSRVEDIHGDDVQVRGGCRTGSIYGRRVRIEGGCDVDSVQFTESLRADPSVRFRTAPQKTEKLPDPPL